MTAIAIETNQLTKQFESARGWGTRSRPEPVLAVSDVSLSIPPGQMFGLLGPNGAGKTTLVKMLCTLISPSSGTARVSGCPLEDIRAIRSSVGLVVSDERSFYWRLSARRNLAFFAGLHGLSGQQARDRVNLALAQVQLTESADRRFSEFSSGMKQRLSIARSLLHQPQILFLDEPSRSLDPTGSQRLHQLLLEMMNQQGMTFFLITHDLNEAEKLCQQVALMHQGRIRANGTPKELRSRLQPQRHHFVTTDRLEHADVSALQEHMPAVSHQLEGSRSWLRFDSVEGDLTLNHLLDFLRQRQIAIRSAESTTPTLEEVFAHFTADR